MRDQLHQVCVETRKGKLLPIGPKAARPLCETLVAEINRQIILGRERLWSNPHIVPVQAKL